MIFGPEAPERVEKLRNELREAPHNLGEVVESLVDKFFEHLPGLITGLVLLFLFWIFARIVVRIVRRVMERARTEEEARDLLLPLIRFTILAIGFLMAIDQMGFEVRSLLAGLGIAGLAVGLAAQETIANMIAGFSILWDRPFGLGDTITTGGVQGEVTQIGLRQTRMRTAEYREVILPNKEIVRQAIINHTRFPEIRVAVTATLAHGSSIEKARRAILEAIARDVPAVEKPAPQVAVMALGDLGPRIEIRIWVLKKDLDAWPFPRLLEIVETALAGAGIELARPPRLELPAPPG